MAIITTRARSASVSDRAFLSLAGVAAQIVAWNEARRTRAILSKLSQHELADIGLNAGDIDNIR